MNELPTANTPDLATYVLAATVHKMKKKALRRVVQMYNLESEPGDSPSKLRRTVKHFIRTSIKGKRFLQSSNRQRSRNSNEDKLRDIRNRWPEVLSDSLMDVLVDDFKKKTSSTQLAASVCASCAETTLKVHSQTVSIADIDLTVLRRPDCHPSMEANDYSGSDGDSDSDEDSQPRQDSFWLHPSVTPPPFPYSDGILKDILVDPKGVIEEDGEPESFVLCESCSASLLAGRIPALAIANRLLLGEVPNESRGRRDLKETPRVELFFSAARGRPTYYVIRHPSIYGNSDIIAGDIFLDFSATTNKPHKPNSLVPFRAVCILSDTSIFVSFIMIYCIQSL